MRRTIERGSSAAACLHKRRRVWRASEASRRDALTWTCDSCCAVSAAHRPVAGLERARARRRDDVAVRHVDIAHGDEMAVEYTYCRGRTPWNTARSARCGQIF